MTSEEMTKRHFDKVAENYKESNDVRFCRPAYGRLAEEVRKTVCGKVLDVSCGSGILVMR